MAHSAVGATDGDPLAASRWTRTKRANPELTKALAYVQQGVGEARRLLAITQPDSPASCDLARAELTGILDGHEVDSLTEDDAWELYTAIKQAVLLIENQAYLSMLLEREAVRDGRHDAWHRWTTHFSVDELTELREALRGPPAPEACARAARRLGFLFAKRAEAGRERRAKAAVKKRAAAYVAPTLLLLLATLIAGIDIDQGATWRDALVAATAGAVGAALAGFIKLRDRLVELDDLRAFATTIAIQPLVGATSGLVVLLVVESGIIEIGGGPSHQTPGRTLLAFAAGFSEPFFLGLVQKVTHDKASDASVADEG
jgi:hypothetical protein